MKNILKVFFILSTLVFAGIGELKAQVVGPPGGVTWWTSVPGLTNEMWLNVTNIIDGGSTGSSSGQVEKVSNREYRIKFPYTMVDALSNNIQGSFTIDPSGTSTVTYLPGYSFISLPSVTFTLRDTNADMLVTPSILSLSTNQCTVKFISSGGLVTNEWRCDYRANYGLSYGVVDDIGTIAMIVDGTNVFRRDGTFTATGNWDLDGYDLTDVDYMNLASIRITGGALAGSWLSGDAAGDAVWQSRLAANLNDYTSIFLADGSHLATGNWHLDNYSIDGANNIEGISGLFGRLYLGYPGGPGVAPAGYHMGVGPSGTFGEMTWQTFPIGSAWYMFPAYGSVNLNNYNLYGVNNITANGGNIAGLNSVNITASGNINFTAAGGIYDAPKMRVTGVTRFDEIGYFDKGILALGNPTYANCAFYAAGKYGCEGAYLCGTYPWIVEKGTIPGLIGGLIGSQQGIFVSALGAGAATVFLADGAGNVSCSGTFTAGGVKSFKIEHPVDTNKYLLHASVESPNPELIYRGKTTLSAGVANVNLNTYYGLITNTLDSVLTNLSVCVYNNASWTRVRCFSVSGVDFSIIAETNTCVDEVEWVAIGRRCDAGVTNYMVEVDK